MKTTRQTEKAYDPDFAFKNPFEKTGSVQNATWSRFWVQATEKFGTSGYPGIVPFISKKSNAF